MNNTLAIIPARGGSKGIPGKNIISVAGKPLIAWSIEHALNSACIQRVIVSTDSDEIAEVSTRYGAEIVKRPAAISLDDSSTEDALIHAIEFIEKQEHYIPENIVLLQATSPIRPPKAIDEAFELFTEKKADSLFSSCVVEGFTWIKGGNPLTPLNYNPLKRPMRQGLKEKVIEENGSFYIFKRELILKSRSRLGGKIITYSMPKIYSFQVDEPEDLIYINMLLSLKL